MSSLIHPHPLSARRKPAQLTYFGGFKNVSFHSGQIVVADAAARNTEEPRPGKSSAARIHNQVTLADIAKEIAAARERSAAARQQKGASAASAEEAAVSDIDQL